MNNQKNRGTEEKSLSLKRVMVGTKKNQKQPIHETWTGKLTKVWSAHLNVMGTRPTLLTSSCGGTPDGPAEWVYDQGKPKLQPKSSPGRVIWMPGAQNKSIGRG